MLLPPLRGFKGHTHIQLRLYPSKNHQSLGINWASEFEFEARLKPLAGP